MCAGVCVCVSLYVPPTQAVHVCVCRRCILMCIRLRSSSNDRPWLGLSMLTHQCCFKCLLPWKQAACIQVWYTDNGLPLFPRLLLYPLFTQFSLPPPPHLSLSYIPILFCFLPWFSSIHVSRPSSRPTPPPSRSPSFHSVWRFYLSQFIHVNLAAMLSHLCPLLSFHHPLHLSRHHLHLSFLSSIHVSTCASSPLIPPISVFSFYPSVLSSISVYWSNTNTQKCSQTYCL